MISRINLKYGLNVKTKGNKAALVEQVEVAVMLANFVQEMIVEDGVNENDSDSENDDNDSDVCDDEDGDFATDVE